MPANILLDIRCLAVLYKADVALAGRRTPQLSCERTCRAGQSDRCSPFIDPDLQRGQSVELARPILNRWACRKHLDDFLRGRIIGLKCGHTHLEVSKELGIAQSVISRLWQQFQDDGNVSRCYSTGRPRVTTPNEDRYLAVTAKRNRRSTASDLSRQLSSATGMTVSG
ncbi:paired domain-containing protein [Trichonephila clavipes]|nr:paired domain-containing protein [Trichonephila clavipes]